MLTRRVCVATAVMGLWLIWCQDSSACWRLKCCGHGSAAAPAYSPSVIAAPSAAAAPAMVPAIGGTDPDPIACPPGFIRVVCKDNIWKPADPGEEAEGCIREDFVGTRCASPRPPQPPKKIDVEATGVHSGPKQWYPMVCDRRTGCWRSPRCCEKPHAYLPINHLGTSCGMPVVPLYR